MQRNLLRRRNIPRQATRQYEKCGLDVLLWGLVSIRHDRRQPLAIGGIYVDGHACAHAADSHQPASREIPNRTPPSDFIH